MELFVKMRLAISFLISNIFQKFLNEVINIQITSKYD